MFGPMTQPFFFGRVRLGEKKHGSVTGEFLEFMELDERLREQTAAWAWVETLF